MQLGRTIIAVILVAAIMVSVFPYTTLAQSGSSPDLPGLSPYWNSNVSRWEPFILPSAQERNLDPDLIAAVIWKESLGHAWERGPVGAVGLMGIMPFDWRPSAEELENPWTNVAWGARALAHTIRDGQGDLYYALAAYNGGWEKIHLRVTRSYAADVLNYYARAVAVRYGLPADGDWVAIFATEGASNPSTITTVGPQRSLARYTERPWIQADIPAVPAGVPPHSTAITFADERGVEHQVNVWLVAADASPLISPPVQTAFSPSSPTTALNPSTVPAQSPTPTNTPTPRRAGTATVPAGGVALRPGATTWWYPTHTLPAGTELILSGFDSDFPDWVYVHTVDGASTGWVQIADLNINHENELSSLPKVTPVPTLTPVPYIALTPTPTIPVACQGGPLEIEAWDLDKANLGHGWTTTIYIQGRGGDCMYTYAWDGEVKGGPTSGSVTFEVTRPDRFGAIMGTASVTSTGQTVEVKLFIQPP